jgi:hypothetical protein
LKTGYHTYYTSEEREYAGGLVRSCIHHFKEVSISTKTDLVTLMSMFVGANIPFLEELFSLLLEYTETASPTLLEAVIKELFRFCNSKHSAVQIIENSSFRHRMIPYLHKLLYNVDTTIIATALHILGIIKQQDREEFESTIEPAIMLRVVELLFDNNWSVVSAARSMFCGWDIKPEYLVDVGLLEGLNREYNFNYNVQSQRKNKPNRKW